jgi:hypothetical protein
MMRWISILCRASQAGTADPGLGWGEVAHCYGDSHVLSPFIFSMPKICVHKSVFRLDISAITPIAAQNCQRCNDILILFARTSKNCFKTIQSARVHVLGLINPGLIAYIIRQGSALYLAREYKSSLVRDRAPSRTLTMRVITSSPPRLVYPSQRRDCPSY